MTSVSMTGTSRPMAFVWIMKRCCSSRFNSSRRSRDCEGRDVLRCRRDPQVRRLCLIAQRLGVAGAPIERARHSSAYRFLRMKFASMLSLRSWDSLRPNGDDCAQRYIRVCETGDSPSLVPRSEPLQYLWPSATLRYANDARHTPARSGRILLVSL